MKTYIFFMVFSILLSSCTEPNNPPNNDPDTTSHNFSWTIDTIGTKSSVLLDVAIIAENDIWVVGEIFTDEQTPFNAIHWNGQEWELKRLFSDKVISPVRGIWAISDDDLWLAAGSIYHWDGTKANLSYLRDINTSEIVHKLWYNSENEIYGIGTDGLIVHYNGQSWQRMDSGTDLPIQDIWGANDTENGELILLCIASDKYHNIGKKLMEIEGNQIVELNSNGLSWSLSSIWFIPNRIYYIAGDGIYSLQNLEIIWQKDTSFIPLYKDAIRGQAANDIVVSGSNGLLSHFNGNTWKHFTYNELPFITGRYYSTEIKDNTVVAVGSIGQQAIVVHGRR